MKKFIILLFFLFDSTCIYAALPSDIDRQKAIDDALTDTEISITHNSANYVNHRFNSDPTVPPKPILSHKRNFDLAFQTESYNYTTGDKWPYYYTTYDNFTSSDKVKKSGSLYGVYASSSWNGPLHTWSDFWKNDELPNFAKIEFDMSKGSTDYSSYVTGKLKPVDAWNLDGRILLGYDYILNSSTDYTPYVGFGYQRYSDKTGGWEDFLVLNYAPFTTITSMFYIPIGVETHTKLNDQWDVNCKMEGDVVVGGNVAYHLNDIAGTFVGRDASTGDLVNIYLKESTSDLNGGVGFRTSLKLIKKFKYYDLYIEPFFKLLYLNKTKEVQERGLGTNGVSYVSAYQGGGPYTPIWDPKNTTVNIGARAGVEF